MNLPAPDLFSCSLMPKNASWLTCPFSPPIPGSVTLEPSAQGLWRMGSGRHTRLSGRAAAACNAPRWPARPSLLGGGREGKESFLLYLQTLSPTRFSSSLA